MAQSAAIRRGTVGSAAVAMQIVGCLLSQYVPVSEGWSYVVGHFELALLYFATKKINIKAINNTVNYISAKLNTIYIIQWMLVGTATFVVMMAGMDDLNAGPAILLGFAFVVLSVLISKLYDRITTRGKK